MECNSELVSLDTGRLVGAICDLLRNAASRAKVDNIVDNVVWAGTIGKVGDSGTEETLTAISAKLHRDHQCCPVFAKSSIIEGYYEQYCKQVLWPNFHYELPDASRPKKYQHSWDHYKMVNEQIAEAVVERYKEGDTIWVSDYHLLLVPNCLSVKSSPKQKIGFFHHICFPTSEV